MVKILEEIELNEVGTNGMLFDIYFDEHSNRFRAKDINGTLTLEYDLIGVAEQIAQEHREEILTYRLGRFTNEDVVDIGDIFMYGKFNRLVEHKTWEVANNDNIKEVKDFATWLIKCTNETHTMGACRIYKNRTLNVHELYDEWDKLKNKSN